MSEAILNNKRIAKNTLLLYFRMLLTMTVALYTSRVVLKTLGVEDYGIYNVVGGVVAMFTFINSAMSSATMRYMAFELGCGDGERLHRVFSTSMGIHALISLVILLLAETVGVWFLNTYMVIPEARMDAAHWVFQLSVLSIIVMMMSVPYNASIIAHEKMSAFAYISVLEVVLKLAVVYMLLIFDIDKLKLYAVLVFCVQMLVCIIYGHYCNRHFEECHYKLVYDKPLFKEMAGFAGWNLFGNLAFVTYTQGVNILLNMFFGPVVNAARAVAVQVQHAVQGFVANFQMALNPQITKTYANGEMEQMHRLVFASGRYSFFLLFFLSLPVMIEAAPILSVWLDTVPNHTVNFIRLTLCIMMVDVLSNPLITAAQATGRIKVYQTVVGGFLLSIVPLSYFALKIGGQPEVVFVIHFVMGVAAQIVRLIMIRSMIHLSLWKYFREVVVKIMCVVLTAIILPVAVYFLLPQNTLYSFLVVCGMCVISVSASVYYLGLGEGERCFVIEKMNGFRQKMFKR